MTAISALESMIRECERKIEFTQDEIKSIEYAIEEYMAGRAEKIELINDLNKDAVKLNESLDILKGGAK